MCHFILICLVNNHFELGKIWFLYVSFHSKFCLNNFRMSALTYERVWLDKNVYNDAEKNYYESLYKVSKLLVIWLDKLEWYLVILKANFETWNIFSAWVGNIEAWLK